MHLVSLYECESGIVLSQEAGKSKENEITASAAFLHPVLVKGRIISTDALHTQKKWCAGVHAYEGYYLVIAKENQPGVLQDLIDFLPTRTSMGENGSIIAKCKKAMAAWKYVRSGPVPR